ncbi:MAG TPA: SsrA-binding protein SmpB [Candidatus Dormibacteraeota bacterium]|nr:SsrA-binding protein SmpB [Candidatus Dormibacteraeota bacterium]
MASPKKKTDRTGERVVAQNRSASHEYLFLEKYEAGMELAGSEVKSLREGKASIREAYGDVRRGELWLEHCHIPPYTAAGYFNHDPLRPKRLLLHRREIDRLAGQLLQKGLTVVPLRIFFRDGYAKCEIALARGRKVYDHRAAERDREAKREASEALYHYRRRG